MSRGGTAPKFSVRMPAARVISLRRQKEVHALVTGVGAQEADEIEAPLDGVLKRVGGRHGGRVGES